jgi:hypothetical protein
VNSECPHAADCRYRLSRGLPQHSADHCSSSKWWPFPLSLLWSPPPPGLSRMHYSTDLTQTLYTTTVRSFSIDNFRVFFPILLYFFVPFLWFNLTFRSSSTIQTTPIFGLIEREALFLTAPSKWYVSFNTRFIWSHLLGLPQWAFSVHVHHQARHNNADHCYTLATFGVYLLITVYSHFKDLS